ncbi:hypothetical protein Pmar_PMAR025243, partial [Perkinsus marinus ATCC 50983]
ASSLPHFDHVPNWRDLLGPSLHSNVFGEVPDDGYHIRVKALDDDSFAGDA